MPYVGAPYNFSSLPSNPVIRTQESIPNLNELNDKNFSGEIYYTVEAKTDIIVGDMNGNHFYKNIDGEYAIKGSSMRGLIRSNMQILGLGSIKDDVNGDYKMMYRRVGGFDSDLKDTYEGILGTGSYRASMEEGGGTVSVRKNVKAGFLCNNGGKYYIYPSVVEALNRRNMGEQNYYILRENAIIGALQRNEDSYRFKYLTKTGMNVLMYESRGRYPFGRRGDVDRNAYNTSFRPSFKEITFHVGMQNKIDQVAGPDHELGIGWHHGYIVSSGYMNKKKAHYVVEGDMKDLDNLKPITVPEDAIRAYEADYESRKNLFGTTQSMRGLSKDEADEVKKANREFYKLPSPGQCKPVFYIEYGHLYFGFTPNLRLYYNGTIEDGIPGSNKNTKRDYAKSIMGYSLKEDVNGKTQEVSRKSRVAVFDAVLICADQHPEGKAQFPVLGGPKPTSYYDYLEQNSNQVVTYNEKEYTIRGYKQYWLHQEAKDFSGESNQPKNKKVASSFIPLKAGAKFQGKIRFNNLTEDELGLLLWCIRLEEGCEQNIGKAKAYGYGRISFQIDNLRLFNLKDLYKSSTLNFKPYSDSSDIKMTVELVDQYIQKYKTYMSSKDMLGSNIMGNISIAQFLLMKHADSFVPEERISYMKLNPDYGKREQERNIMSRSLPKPDEVQKNIPTYLQPAFTYAKSKQKKQVSKIGKVNEVAKSTSSTTTDSKLNKNFKQGDVVTGIVNNFFKKGNECNGVFLTLPGMKKGLLHKSNARKDPNEYDYKEKVNVRVIEYSTIGGKIKIGLSDKDIPQD